LIGYKAFIRLLFIQQNPITMKTIKIITAAIFLASVIFITGCKKDNNGDAATIQFKMMDAPADFDALFINVTAIEVKTDDGEWHTYNSTIGTVNVLDLVNGNTVIIANADVDGDVTVKEIRLVLGSNNSIVVDGQTYALDVPSGQSSGLKIKVNQKVKAGGDYVWTVDFDAASSVVQNGNGSYHLKPVLRVIVDSESTIAGGADVNSDGIIDVSFDDVDEGGIAIIFTSSGTITGSIGTVGLASVCLTDNNNNTFCTMTNLQGNFIVSGVGTGNYTVTIDAVAPLIATKIIQNVHVDAGQTTALGVIVM
jgi:hypothetical protein